MQVDKCAAVVEACAYKGLYIELDSLNDRGPLNAFFRDAVARDLRSRFNDSLTTRVGFAISVHFFKSGFSDIFHAKSGYPDFIRIFLCRSVRPLYTFSNCK